MMPGKKGISLTVADWQLLKKAIAQVDEAVA
jgi:Transcriptional Coactivator p15 (PC4)